MMFCVIERVMCTQVVKFQEDYMKSLAWTLPEISYLIFLVYIY